MKPNEKHQLLHTHPRLLGRSDALKHLFTILAGERFIEKMYPCKQAQSCTHTSALGKHLRSPICFVQQTTLRFGLGSQGQCWLKCPCPSFLKTCILLIYCVSARLRITFFPGPDHASIILITVTQNLKTLRDRSLKMGHMTLIPYQRQCQEEPSYLYCYLASAQQ